ncbi:FKBP-type peptidyl-prolyl cis-trans isomerase [Vibrio algivorus]|uniref:Peptidyl-prolyl cis-trans isomerase n=1 Tax=Vibrio algivorus TaxID=1667024 RepID=A0A557P142_9VIBR|nr:FKBP-type peptidyl-prolyl cis-trans isomerase [Vibrio algivorus]TVO34334.1 FKBP-type peptidyl-prolyl cis-trans isomerase [Vibrio algivorus]
MKPIFKVSLLAATVLLAVGCQKEESKDAQTTVKAEQAQSAAASTLYKTDDEKAAYAIGVSFANYLNTSIEKPAEIGINLDKDIVLKGIEDVFAQKAGMTEEETHQALQELDKRVSEKMQAQAAEKSAAAKKAGDDFRAEFAKEDGVKKTESGILYKVEKEGDGISPKATDTVVVNYEGTLVDGTKFDSSYDRKEPATFPLNRVIPGWTESVQLMKVGSKYKVVIPPELAYGEQDTPTIPANSTLVFEIELMSVKSAEAPEAPAAN